MNKLKLTKATIDDAEEIFAVTSIVYDEFVAPSYSKEGNEEFYKYLNLNEIKKRISENHFILVAKQHDKIVGLIEIKDCDHLSLLFVLKEFQEKGIAKKLLSEAIVICKENKPNIQNISVNSSPNALKIYEKLGFTATNKEQLKNGIKFTPMELKI